MCADQENGGGGLAKKKTSSGRLPGAWALTLTAGRRKQGGGCIPGHYGSSKVAVIKALYYTRINLVAPHLEAQVIFQYNYNKAHELQKL